MSSSCPVRYLPSFSTTIWSVFFTVLRRCATMTTVLSFEESLQIFLYHFLIVRIERIRRFIKTGNRDYGKWRALSGCAASCPLAQSLPRVTYFGVIILKARIRWTHVYLPSLRHAAGVFIIMRHPALCCWQWYRRNMNPSCITTPQCLRHSLKLIFVATDCLSSPLLRWEDRIRASVLSALFSTAAEAHDGGSLSGWYVQR